MENSFLAGAMKLAVTCWVKVAGTALDMGVSTPPAAKDPAMEILEKLRGRDIFLDARRAVVVAVYE